MSFKYINPGYPELFDSGYTSTMYVLENNIYNPYNGKNLVFSDSTLTKNTSANKHIYVKFGAYIINGSNYASANIKINDTGIHFVDTNGSYLDFYIDGTKKESKAGCYVDGTGYTEFILDVLSDATSGYLKVYANSNIIYSYSGPINDGNDFTSVAFSHHLFNDGKIYLNNIIISDTEINAKEKILIAPISSINTDWNANSDGTYYCNDENKSLLQSIDVAKLIETVGNQNFKIISIAINEIPGYYDTSGNLKNIKTILQENGINTEVEEKTLNSISTKGTYTNALEINPFTSTEFNVSDLSSLFFGIKSVSG